MIFIAPEAFAQKVKIGALHFPPFYEVDSQSEVSGHYIDLLKKIFDNAGLEYSISGYPPKRLYVNLAKGKVDVWMGTKGVEVYEGKTFVVEEKITDIFLRVFTTGKTQGIKKVQDLNNKRIITILGYNYGGFVKYLDNPENNIRTDQSSTHELAFKKLKAGRADYLLDYKYPSDAVLKDMDIPDLKWDDIKTIGIYIFVSKKAENAEEIFEKISKSVEQLKKSGDI
ncbi:MAG: substrate-binding periplasmic protein [Thermodesulfobacteriota bacterium]